MARSWGVSATLLAVFAVATAPARSDAAPAFAARCDDGAQAAPATATAEWWRWSRETLPVGPDGVDFSRIKKLVTTDPATAERMLRLGLSLCDPTAAQAITV